MSTQIKEVPISGLSTSPSDYTANDGHLAAAINVFHEDDSITPASACEPDMLLKMPSNYSVVYNHENDDYKHLIIEKRTTSGDDTIYRYFFIDVTNGYPELFHDPQTPGMPFSAPEYLTGIECQIKKIVSVGNSLVMYSEDNVFYSIWIYGKYNMLGSHMPGINISFGLKRNTLIDRSRNMENNQNVAYGYIKGNGALVSEEYCKSNSMIWINKITGLKKDTMQSYIAEDNQQTISDSVMGAVNRFVSEEHDKGRFVHPFIIRYAYRLFDETITMHSCPVLMVTNTGISPLCVVDQLRGNSDNNDFFFHIEGCSYNLDYLVDSNLSDLKKWSDIIKSVDIFVSRPLYPYDASDEGRCTHLLCGDGYSESESFNHYDIFEGWKSSPYFNKLKSEFTISKGKIGSNNGEMQPGYLASSIFHVTYKASDACITTRKDNDDRYYFYNNYADAVYCGAPVVVAELPVKSEETRRKEIQECSDFFLIKSIPISDIEASNRSDIVIEKGVLNNISTHERMVDDFYSNDLVMPNNVSVYNNRANFSGAKRICTYVPPIRYMVCNQDVFENNPAPTKIRMLESGSKIVIESRSDSIPKVIPYLCYPNPNAKEIQYKAGDLSKSYELVTHKGLNASVFFKGFFSESIDGITSMTGKYSTGEEIEKSGKNYIVENSTIYTSDTDNPFIFRAANVEQIGTGRIIALVPAAQALSTGQFGDYPMYAFTTDGIWALYPSETGGWKSKQPISRDVALSAETILQLDQSVIFVTARGLMQIEGSKVECISEIFDGAPDSMLSMYTTNFSQIIKSNSDIRFTEDLLTSFRGYIKTCHMHYDYSHQRIIISNASHDFCFVFNMKDRVWTTLALHVDGAINSYPQAYAMSKSSDNNNVLIDFSSSTTAVLSSSAAQVQQTQQANPAQPILPIPSDGFLLTRPLKLDAPDTLKTVRTVIARGNFQPTAGKVPGHVDLILYGSRDLHSWHILGSTKGERLTLYHGTPFKYFRVGIITHLTQGESITSISIEYEPKMQDRIR